MFRCAFTIESDTRYLAVLRGLVPAAFSAAGMGRMPRAARVACTLALIEAVDNAIFHAHRRVKSLPICVSVGFSPDAISIEVVDCGSGIGRRFKARPDSMETHGRGL
nr:ATP-binding protein [bacterium]